MVSRAIMTYLQALPPLSLETALKTHAEPGQPDDVSQLSSSEQGDDEERRSGSMEASLPRKALRSDYSESTASTESTVAPSKSARSASFGSSLEGIEHSLSCNSQGTLGAEVTPNLSYPPLRQTYRDFAACAIGICNCFSPSHQVLVSRGARDGCQIAKQDTEAATLSVYSRALLLQVGFASRQHSADAPLYGLAPSLEITKAQRPSKHKPQSSPSVPISKLARGGTDSDEALPSSSDMQMEHVLRCMLDDTSGSHSHHSCLAGHDDTPRKDVLPDDCDESLWFCEAAPLASNLDCFNQADYAWAAHFNAAASAHQNAGNNFAGSFEQLPNFWNSEGVTDEYHISDSFARTEEEVEWETQLVQQVEYYFSEVNLSQDLFLCSLMDDDGWVALSELINFPRMQHLQATVEHLRHALVWSYYLEMSLVADHVRIRDVWLRTVFLMQTYDDVGMSSQFASACNSFKSKTGAGRSRRRSSVCRLATSLTEIEDEDANCVLMVHRVHRLGFGSAETLRKYCEKYGPVLKVLLSNKHNKDEDDPKQARLRPSGIAFVVMQDTRGAAAVLGAGEVQEIEGAQLSFRQFVKHEHPPSQHRTEVKSNEELVKEDVLQLAGA